MMPTYAIPAYQNSIPRNAVVLDTNVLVAAFHPRDQNHEDARLFIDDWPDPFFVPIAVLVETWNMIVGSCKYWRGGIEFLTWLRTPGNAELLPQDTAPLDEVAGMIDAAHVDCVDAFLSDLADDMSRQCNLTPSIKIATYDTADFMKCRSKGGLRLVILDMRTLEEY